MEIVWDEVKRQGNLANHGLDFARLTPDFFASVSIVSAKQESLLAVGDLE